MSADTVESNKSIAVRIQNLCKSSGITQSRLQKDLGISKNSFAKYVSGENAIPRERLIQIADYFNVSTDYLFGRCEYTTRETGLASVCEYTGLSESAVSQLVWWKDRNKPAMSVLNELLASKDFNLLLWQIIDAKSYVQAAVSDASSRPPIPTPLTYNQRTQAEAEWYVNTLGDYSAELFARFLVDDMVDQLKATLMDLIGYSALDAIGHFGGDSDGK